VAPVVQGKKRHKPPDANTVVPPKQKRKSVGAAAVVHKKQMSKLAAKNKTKKLTTAFPDCSENETAETAKG